MHGVGPVKRGVKAIKLLDRLLAVPNVPGKDDLTILSLYFPAAEPL